METSTIERRVYDQLSPDFNLGQVKKGDILTKSFERDGVTHKFKGLVISTEPFITISFSSGEGVVKEMYNVRSYKEGKAVLALANLTNANVYEPENIPKYLTQLREAELI